MPRTWTARLATPLRGRDIPTIRAEGTLAHRSSLLAVLLAACALTSTTTTAAAEPGTTSPPPASPYAFTCSWSSLTGDFASRDALPQSPDPVANWYQTNAAGHFVNGGWGPRSSPLPPPSIPENSGCDATTWKRERILAVAMRYLDTPGNPLGLQYRHHHVPGWDPSTSTYAGAADENPDTDAPQDMSAWGAGNGLDCSNFTAWVYDYGLGIVFDGNVHDQYAGAAGPMGTRIDQDGPFEPGDLLYLHPDGNPNQASHVVVYVDDQHVIDSRIDAQNVPGVNVRQRVGWYRTAVLGGWRPIG
jgi:cell wall-associated NlpC family hydrolase